MTIREIALTTTHAILDDVDASASSVPYPAVVDVQDALVGVSGAIGPTHGAVLEGTTQAAPSFCTPRLSPRPKLSVCTRGSKSVMVPT